MRAITSCLFLLFCFIRVEANNIQVVKDGPVHEAFITKESGSTILQAVPDRPPPPITEEMPRSIDASFIWIPGYWAWLADGGEYIWVSGIWRKPPEQCIWIPGYWKNYHFGWVWMPGFWSPEPESELTYLSEPPPDPINEPVPTPPASQDAYFWVPGHWEWQADAHAYRWMSGRWGLLGQHQIYVPAHYYWREKGYIFVPGYWDWSLDARGIVYAPVSIPEEDRSLIVFEPSAVINSLYIMEKLFPFWPDYAVLFHYHFYYHRDLWVAWGPVPPWWKWTSWWALPSQDAWWLWWWWSHSRYPNPPWIDSGLAEKIVPPSEMVVKIMKSIEPPPIVTPNGVVGAHDLIQAIETATGKKNPILSSDPKQVEQIQDLADPQNPKPPYLRPTGTGNQSGSVPSKPSTPLQDLNLKLHPGRVNLIPSNFEEGQKVPIQKPPFPEAKKPQTKPKPKAKNNLNPYVSFNQFSFNPPVSGHNPYYLRNPNVSVIPPQGPPAHTPSYSPRAYRPDEPPPPVPPPHEPYTPPAQGWKPDYEYPQTSRQSQHLDHLMTEPQPQENPAGPKAHQLPGDESTLPNY